MRVKILQLVGAAATVFVAASCSDQPTTPRSAPLSVASGVGDECDATKEVCGIGRMTGGGPSITVGGVKVTKGLTLHCDITLSNNLEINWDGNKWHLDKPIETAECTDDPTISPVPPPAPFDTFHGTATGRLNGEDGSRCEFTFVDAGEPGGKNDRAGIRIWDAAGNLVLDLPLSPTDGGNLQAHYDQPHGSNVNR
ncbi:MAG TPA: hypothetical protein VJR92_15510 [Gemmatimonadaceae bacterium]|nr:hypothetical protein [Gemmatimonadaceae bacterium]